MKKIEIKSRFSGKVIFSVEAESLKIAVELAIKSGANLSRADLYGAYLSRAYLSGANLSRADLSRANLSGADLSRAYLSGAKKPPINSHQFASEILWRKAKTENQKNFSARIRIETNKCWNDFYVLAKKMKVLAWAKKTLHWQEYQDKIKELEGE